MLGLFLSSILFCKNIVRLVVLIAFVVVRQLICKVLYTLWLSSSISLMTGLIIL